MGYPIISRKILIDTYQGYINKKLYKAEARFVRAVLYSYLYSWFGPVPLRTSTTDPLEMPRATEEEMKSFIETEFQKIIPDLPEPGQESAYGRANKGAALKRIG